MVIDTSAIVAILFQEPDAEEYARAISAAQHCMMSAVSRVELSLVIEGRKGEPGRVLLDDFLAQTGIEIVAVTTAQADAAIDAFRRFGKGRHAAGLNIGDCFAYGLAKTIEQPLLFKGTDFRLTDIPAALPATLA